ncbi:hypothetical protein [Cryobacterium sp. Hb1]|uniref:hypothetical protein n=1 Tax=Cryobacterium sp. Hb1 TaxID=1259147 RepID=UPI001069D5F3|nr:hypothetical protein [Cryobacterium sp. Hb1]TFD66184.1 hypothetical protein E3T38_13415 [Cryobacterium sp. Hb1]
MGPYQLDLEWLTFDTAAGQDGAEFEALIRFAATGEKTPIVSTGHPLAGPPDPAALLDPSVTSAAFDAGSWQKLGIDERVAADVAARLGHAVTRYGQYRLSQTEIDTAEESLTLALGVEVYRSTLTVHTAPMDGAVMVINADAVRLEGDHFDLWLTGVHVAAVDGHFMRAGTILGLATARLTVQISRRETPLDRYLRAELRRYGQQRHHRRTRTSVHCRGRTHPMVAAEHQLPSPPRSPTAPPAPTIF